MAPRCLGIIASALLATLFQSSHGSLFEYQSLYTRVPQSFLKVMPLKVFENTSVEGCARRCVMELEFECKSFDVDNAHSECHLHNHTHTEPLIGLQSSLYTDHYKTAYEKLFNKLPNHVLTMKHNRNIRGLTAEECARRCILEISFKCRGFDYERRDRNCWLTDKAAQDVGGISLRSGTDYYERKSNGPLSQFINYGYGSLQAVEGVQVHNKLVLGVNLDACAQLCVAETAFVCASFDYVFGEESCQMSQYIAANVHGMRTQFTGNYRVMHFELIDFYLTYFYATPFASVLGNNDRTFKKVTPDTCARKCLEERDFVCRSFDYQIQEGTCLLSHVTGSDAGGLYSPDGVHVHHFEMKPYLDCGGYLTGDRGMLASPNWPRHYSHHLNCSWTITVPAFKVIRLDIAHLDLGQQTQNPCDVTNDVLSVIEKGRKRVCIENHMAEFTTLTNNATVRFTTNADHDAQGFRIFYSADWTCNRIMTQDNGEFASPRWPNKYPAMTSCSWTVEGPYHSRINIRFNSIELEDHMGSSCRTAYDKLEVYDGNSTSSPLLRLFCSHMRPVSVTSTGNSLHVVFTSDSRVEAKGFHASYRFLIPTTPTTTTTTTSTTTSVTTTTTSTESIKKHITFTDSNNTYSYQQVPKQGTLLNMSDSINFALKALLATFVEPPASDVLGKPRNNSKNVTVYRSGVIGDDIGRGYTPRDTLNNASETEGGFDTVLMGVILSLAMMAAVIILTLFFICRYHRNQAVKRRNGTNILFAEESVSLCAKNHTETSPVHQPAVAEDVDEAAMLPLPSPHEPPSDVEFHNPLYIKRHGDADEQEEPDISEAEIQTSFSSLHVTDDLGISELQTQTTEEISND